MVIFCFKITKGLVYILVIKTLAAKKIIIYV